MESDLDDNFLCLHSTIMPACVYCLAEDPLVIIIVVFCLTCIVFLRPQILTEHDVYLSYLPMAHIFEQMFVVSPLAFPCLLIENPNFKNFASLPRAMLAMYLKLWTFQPFVLLT